MNEYLAFLTNCCFLRLLILSTCYHNFQKIISLTYFISMHKNDLLGSGLVNMGNTCFINATIQCLLHSNPFYQDLKSKKHSISCNIRQWCVYCEMENVWTNTRNGKVYEPKQLVLNLKKLFNKFKLGRQQDSHQFLRYFIEGLQQADIGYKQKNPEKIKVLVENSRIFSLFGGKMKSSIQCQSCHYKSQIIEHFYDISLECQKSNSVQEGLSSYFKIYYLIGNNKYHCSSCKKSVDANKRFLLNKLPKILSIQLKRFTNTLHKLNKFVQYPQHLQLQKYCQMKTTAYYKLCGIVVHAGSTSFSGHYYSFNRVGDNWYKMDDTQIKKTQKQIVLNQKAYLLFYERVQTNNHILQKQLLKQVQTTKSKKQQQEKRCLEKVQQKQIFSQPGKKDSNINSKMSKQKNIQNSLQSRRNISQLSVNTNINNKKRNQIVKNNKPIQEQEGKSGLQKLKKIKKRFKLSGKQIATGLNSSSSPIKKKIHQTSPLRRNSLQKLRNFTSRYFWKYLIQQIVLGTDNPQTKNNQ